MNLTREELRSAVIGMVLGDGCLTKRWENGEACFQLSQCEKQYDYLLWKQNILNKITSSKINKTERTLTEKDFSFYKDKPKTFYGYHLNTNRHPFFTKLYNRFYHTDEFGKKVKVVDEYLVKKINPLALAIWFMDDGCSGENKRTEHEKPSYYLCTNNFDYANQLLLKKSLKLNFNLDWNINKAEVSKDGSYNYRLRLAQRENEKFLEIVRPLIIPSLQYKLKLNSEC